MIPGGIKAGRVSKKEMRRIGKEKGKRGSSLKSLSDARGGMGDEVDGGYLDEGLVTPGTPATPV